MKLVLISDTHIRSGQSLLALLPDDLITMLKKCDLIIHAGDFESLAGYHELTRLGEVVAVHGDTDAPELMTLLPERKVMQVEGVRIGIVHRAQLTSDTIDGLRYLAREMEVDVLVFGHFHHPVVEQAGVLLLSPGSSVVPGVAEPSAIELEITGNTVNGKIIRCTGEACSYFKYTKT